MDKHNYQSIEDELRFMLQTAAKKSVVGLSETHKKLLHDLHEAAVVSLQDPQNATPESRGLLEAVNRVVCDLGLSNTSAVTGTVLNAVNSCINKPVDVVPNVGSIESNKYVIWFQCADHAADPVVMSTPAMEEDREQAYVYTDTTIFSGFSGKHMQILKDLGIKEVSILSFDGVQYDQLTPGFVPLVDQRLFTATTTEGEINATYTSAFALLVVFFAVIILGHKILR